MMIPLIVGTNKKQFLESNSFLFMPGAVVLEVNEQVEPAADVTRSEFQQVIDELFLDFANFQKTATITQSIGFDYKAQQADKTTQTVQLIPTGTNEVETTGGAKVRANRLVCKYSGLTFIPSPDNTTITYNNDEHYQVVSVDLVGDGDAAVIMDVVRL